MIFILDRIMSKIIISLSNLKTLEYIYLKLNLVKNCYFWQNIDKKLYKSIVYKLLIINELGL
jgi:hypothetical protein